MKWKKVFIEDQIWKKEVMMYLTSLGLKAGKPVFSTQLFKFDGATLAVTIIVAVVAFLLGSVIF